MLPQHTPRLMRCLAATAATLCILSGPVYAQKPDLDVPYVQTPQPVVDKMLELAAVRSDDYVIDLGSGDGRIPITAAKRYGARGLGVDLNPERVKEAKANAEASGVADKVEFRERNLFDTNISEASVLTMYLLSRINMQLRPRILEDLKPGTRVVSHAFDMGEWKPDRHETVDGRNVYFWVVPAKVEGRWMVSQGDRRFELNLDQDFQQVRGSANVNGRTERLEDVRLRGGEISFVLDTGEGPRRFSGIVDGHTITPTEATGAAEGQSGQVAPARDWRASRAS